jgi:hypothetical protein
MKQLYLLLFLSACTVCSYGQKYIFLDTKIAEPPYFADAVSPADKAKGYFPVGKKDIGRFIEILGEIADRLSAKQSQEKARQYEMGCIKFTGITFRLSSGDRTDYVITSTCGQVKITMHLSDGKITNENNAYFIKTWIKYIRAAAKPR